VIRLNRRVYTIGGVLTALALLALAVWGVWAAVGPDSDVVRTTAVALPRPAPAGAPGAAYGAAPTTGPTPMSTASAGAQAPAGEVTTKLAAGRIPRMGAVVTDSDGFVLYRFDKDAAKPPTSNCAGACVKTWAPVLTDAGTPTVEGIDQNLVGTVRRADGGTQLTLAGWPLYRYAGDAKAGSWKGQGVGGTWWVIAPTGKKNLTCVPTATPTAWTPPSGGTGSSTY
jgi:predicted lipoprotein with Yx(FWY)xxD motif